jgi:ABC-2 type transport system permease protein
MTALPSKASLHHSHNASAFAPVPAAAALFRRMRRYDSAMRTLRIAWILFLTVLKRRMAYRGDLILAGLDEIMRGLVALIMLHVYVSKTPSLHGWTQPELLFVLGFSLVPIGLFHTLCGNLYQLSNYYLIQGNLDRVLLRPYPAFLQICFDRIAIEDLSGVLFGLAIMATAVTQMPHFDTSLPHLALLFVLMLSAFGVVVAVFMAFAATGFWFEDRVGMVPPVYNLMEFGRWPTGIYHPALKLLITCVIPFSFVAFYPASYIVRGEDAFPALLTPLVALVALLCSSWLWRTGIRRYHSSGS